MRRAFSFTGFGMLCLLCSSALAACRSAERQSVSSSLRMHRVRVEGGELRLWERAPLRKERNITFLLVHGMTWSARPAFDLEGAGQERSLMRAFARRGYRSFALDQRGYGASPRDVSGWLSPAQAAEDLRHTVHVVREKRRDDLFVLLGWSRGSMVAALAAQDRSVPVDILVLYAYPVSPSKRYAPESSCRLPPRRKTHEKDARSDFILPHRVSPRVVDAFVAQALQADPVRVDWWHLDEFNALRPEALWLPTLVVSGERDPLARPAFQAELMARLSAPDRAWVLLGESAHAAHLEEGQEEFLQAIESFLARRRAPSTCFVSASP